MLLLKRLAVWVLEQLPEAFLLGCLLLALVFRHRDGSRTIQTNLSGLLQVAGVYGFAVAVILFMHGYYASKALFGVMLRSNRAWLYPVIAAALLVIHTHVAFVRVKPDMTLEGKAMELPFVAFGACIAFACAFAGGCVLQKWTRSNSATTPYLSAMAITLLVFILANTAHYLRPEMADERFRAYGLPFIFYREGGFVNGWHWHTGTVLWRGIVADAAVVTVTVALLGTMWQRFTANRPR